MATMKPRFSKKWRLPLAGLAVTGTTLAGVAAVGLLPEPVHSAAESAGTPSPEVPVTVSPGPHDPGPPPTTQPEPPLGDIPKVVSAERIRMPLDAYMTSAGDVQLIEQAGNVAAGLCMKRLGFTGWNARTLATPSSNPAADGDVLEYLDPEKAASTGYPPTAQPKPSSMISRPGMTIDERNAFYGYAPRTRSGEDVPKGGCQRAGDTTILTGEMPSDPRALSADARVLALRDSRVVDAFGAWSRCMAARGLTYDIPLSAPIDPRWGQRDPGAPPSEAEQKTAVSDAECQASVNVVGVYKAAKSAYETQLIEQNNSQLTKGLEVFKQWVENAQNLINENS
ncbi:hypothetical protein [Actinomadura sp. NEAU-AAG7]|uniref:hypothetical protein n=1 Tax=Actinomadura sp. NEAU-AAG7 TaxID=2839640 RepID=UPI001BE4B350|nr:hypothetical protein [Actinomadura sp. NEAU-AAG7]MBT2208896.1 hypothetical protein [Actinomadura sp. NEAU-AAG7]